MRTSNPNTGAIRRCNSLSEMEAKMELGLFFFFAPPQAAFVPVLPLVVTCTTFLQATHQRRTSSWRRNETRFPTSRDKKQSNIFLLLWDYCPELP